MFQLMTQKYYIDLQYRGRFVKNQREDGFENVLLSRVSL